MTRPDGSDPGSGRGGPRGPQASELTPPVAGRRADIEQLARIGRYEIVRKVGDGAMGVVFEALDRRLDRRVALKVLGVPGLEGARLAEFRARFFREARTAAMLAHPNIVTIYDVDHDVEKDLAYIAMEFLEGRSLDDAFQQGIRLSRRRVLETGIQVCHALEHAHRHGVVHRDVKPANIVLLPDGTVKLVDFGIAKVAESDFGSGQFMGTPSYMSPEQVTHSDVDARSDLFSFGIIFYELITGERPFRGSTITEVTDQIAKVEPAAPAVVKPGISPQLDELTRRLLAKDREERPASAGEVASILRDLLEPVDADGPPQQSSPRGEGSSFDATLVEDLVPAPPQPAARSAAPPAPKATTPLERPPPPAPASARILARLRALPRSTRLAAAGAAALIAAAIAWAALSGDDDAASPREAAQDAPRPLTAAQVARQELAILPYDDILTSESESLALLRPGYLHYIEGDDFAAAVREFDRVARKRPDLVEARLLQGVALVMAGRNAEAVPVLEGVLRTHPSHGPTKWYLGQALLAQGRVDEGVAALRRLRDDGGAFSDKAARVVAAADAAR